MNANNCLKEPSLLKINRVTQEKKMVSAFVCVAALTLTLAAVEATTCEPSSGFDLNACSNYPESTCSPNMLKCTDRVPLDRIRVRLACDNNNPASEYRACFHNGQMDDNCWEFVQPNDPVDCTLDIDFDLNGDTTFGDVVPSNTLELLTFDATREGLFDDGNADCVQMNGATNLGSVSPTAEPVEGDFFHYLLPVILDQPFTSIHCDIKYDKFNGGFLNEISAYTKS